MSLTLVGIIGIVIIGIIIIRAFKNISMVFKRSHIMGILLFTLLTTILFSNMFETSLLKINHLYWFLFVLIALSIPENKFTSTPHEVVQDVTIKTTP